MQLEIRFFASFRERLGIGEAQVEVPDTVATVGQLRHWLTENHPDWGPVLDAGERIMVAVNQTLADDQHLLSARDEVAFFPPVTGG